MARTVDYKYTSPRGRPSNVGQNTTRNPFGGGAEIYIADSVGVSNALTRIAAKAAADFYILTLKDKLGPDPARTGKVYTRVHNSVVGEYTSSKPGEGVSSEYPAEFTGDLRDSIRREIKSSDGRFYSVGSDEPQASWVGDGTSYIDPRRFFERNAVEEASAIEDIMRVPFEELSLSQKEYRAMGGKMSEYARKRHLIEDRMDFNAVSSKSMKKIGARMAQYEAESIIGEYKTGSFYEKLKIRLLRFFK